MISPRSKPSPAGIVSALTLVALCAAMLVLPAAAVAAPPEGSPPEGPPAPQLRFDPGNYDFGLQQVNSNANQATVQLYNDGEAPAQVFSLNLVGPNVFWIDGGSTDCYGKDLQPHEACTVRVYFNPYETGTFTAQLRVESEGETVFTADLSGAGGRAILGPVSEPTNFGAVEVGSDGVTKAIDIVNSGNFPGGAFIAVIAGGAIGSFHLLDENCTGVLLSPAASCTLLVNFQPLSAGVKTARLGLFGDSDGGTQVTLTGIGVEAADQTSGKAPNTSAAFSEAAKKPHPKQRRRKSQHRNRRLRAAVSAQRLIG